MLAALPEKAGLTSGAKREQRERGELFRRRRDTGEGRHEARAASETRAGRHVRRASGPGGPAGDLAGPDVRASEQGADRVATGPWDSADQYPRRPRIDVGSLMIPVSPGQDLGLELSDDQSQFVAVSVDIPDGKLQVRAMAAPKTGKLWEDERIGIITEVQRAGGQAREIDGPFGPEVEVHEPVPVTREGVAGLQRARFIGVDGPRWLLVGKISGPVAASADRARPLEEVFADIVVVRGDHPAVPRDVLEILLPTEMREALAQQVAQTQADQERAQFLMPIDRGPEITETR